MTWLGWYYLHSSWHPLPDTQSTDLGKCARLLGVELRAKGLRDTHGAMTGGGVPEWTPRGRGRVRNVEMEFEDI